MQCGEAIRLFRIELMDCFAGSLSPGVRSRNPLARNDDPELLNSPIGWSGAAEH